MASDAHADFCDCVNCLPAEVSALRAALERIAEMSWHAWAEKKARRHFQIRCDECGLFTIWRRKKREASDG